MENEKKEPVKKVTKKEPKKRTKKTEKKKTEPIAFGRPTKYSPEHHIPWAASLMLKGLTIQELADSMQVTKATIYNWAKNYPDFLYAISKNREIANAQVENSLFKTAMGFEYEEEEIKIDENGIETRKIMKRVSLPNPRAQEFWLKNRSPETYRDKHEVEHSGAINNPLDAISETQLAALLAVVENEENE